MLTRNCDGYEAVFEGSATSLGELLLQRVDKAGAGKSRNLSSDKLCKLAHNTSAYESQDRNADIVFSRNQARMSTEIQRVKPDVAAYTKQEIGAMRNELLVWTLI